VSSIPDIRPLLLAREAAFVDLLRESADLKVSVLWAAAACLLDHNARGPAALAQAARHLATLARHSEATTPKGTK